MLINVITVCTCPPTGWAVVADLGPAWWSLGCRTVLLSAVMKLPCSLWFLLLLGAGSLLLLVCLQDLTETVLQQTPGQCWSLKSTVYISHHTLFFFFFVFCIFHSFFVSPVSRRTTTTCKLRVTWPTEAAEGLRRLVYGSIVSLSTCTVESLLLLLLVFLILLFLQLRLCCCLVPLVTQMSAPLHSVEMCSTLMLVMCVCMCAFVYVLLQHVIPVFSTGWQLTWGGRWRGMRWCGVRWHSVWWELFCICY